MSRSRRSRPTLRKKAPHYRLERLLDGLDAGVLPATVLRISTASADWTDQGVVHLAEQIGQIGVEPVLAPLPGDALRQVGGGLRDAGAEPLRGGARWGIRVPAGARGWAVITHGP